MGLTSEEEILRILKEKKIRAPENLADTGPLIQGLWVLEAVKDNTDIKKVTAKTISFILSELEEMPVKMTAIIRAFARAPKKVNATREGEKVFYEIMRNGRQILKNSLNSSTSGIELFTGTKAWSDFNEKFVKLIDSLVGELCIVDPFYGNGTFATLKKFGDKRKIRFLSCNLGDAEKKDLNTFNNNQKRFMKEFKNISMRKYPNQEELHDRYIIADNALVIIGHGLKDLGGRESFIIYLSKEKVSDLLQMLRRTFEKRWNQSSHIN